MDDNAIKDVRNLFRLKKETNDTTIKYMRNLFRLKKENEVIKDSTIRDVRNLFSHEKEENYYKPVRAVNFCSNNLIEYESNGDGIKFYQLKNF